ncbi:MAG: AMP-binding protein [Anaerolineales bacterium]|nr:AMP-binding protein [Anaerolineales bacterium]
MKNFSQILQAAYLEAPGQPAVYLLHSRQPERTITYRQLLHGAARYGRAMKAAGIQPGEVAILILQHSEELIYAFFGAILHGVIPSIMPFLTEKLLPDQYRLALEALFEITAPAAVVTYPEFLGDVARASVGASVRCILSTADIQEPAGGLPGDPGLERLGGLERPPAEIVLLQHSSGTTGLQKGVALSHQAVFNQIESYARVLKLASTDVIVSWLPLYHDMGLIAGFILPILRRIPLVLMSPFDWVRAPYRLFQAISDYKGTLCWLPNFAYNFCAQKTRDRDLQGVDLSSLRAVINCSEPMHWKSHAMFLERFQPYGLRSAALATCYAMAENVFAVTQAGIDEPVNVDSIDQGAFMARQLAIAVDSERVGKDQAPGASRSQQAGVIKMLSAGRPIPGARLRVVDPQGADLPERRVGEIALQSNCMLTGYYHRPDLTEKVFIDGWYLTGDLGYLANGELYVTGRKKDLIIVGGKNIYPQDLERLASEVEGVHPGRVAAFGVFNEQTGTEDVVIVAEADLQNLEDSHGEGERIAAEIRQRVTRGSDIALRYVHVVERNWLIKTSSGKVARSANRDRYIAELSQAS